MADATQAQAPDWLLAQVLFAQGMPATAIAPRVGASAEAVHKRAQRGQWSRLRDETARGMVKATENTIETVLSGYSMDTRKALGRALSEHVAKIPQAKGWKHAKSLQQDLEPLVRNAKVVFGWDAQDARPTQSIRIGVLNCATVKPPSLASTDPPPIDVAPTDSPNPES